MELDDPIGPFGNKALGEPPAIPGAPAIRNAVLHATGVAFNENPLTPQRLIYGFIKAGLIYRGGDFMYDIENYYQAESVKDAVRLLNEHPDARIISGGSAFR